MTHRAEIRKTLIAMPDDVRHWLEQQAQRNVSSLTAEVVRSVRDRMQQTEHAEVVR